MLSIGKKPDAVDRPRWPFWPRRKLLIGRVLLFGGVLLALRPIRTALPDPQHALFSRLQAIAD